MVEKLGTIENELNTLTRNTVHLDILGVPPYVEREHIDHEPETKGAGGKSCYSQ